jgi:gamma-glutamyltranspeptidase / glutathione hydrolase
MRGAIAAGHPKTAEAGIEILRQGGNAFDAAVGAVLAACVAEPTLTSLAGGGFLLAHTQQGQDVLFDFFTQTPHSKRAIAEVDFFPIDVDFGAATQEFHIGLGSVATPGVLAGLWHVHQALGRLPFAAVADPAIQYALYGIEVSPFQSYCCQLLAPILRYATDLHSTYFPGGPIVQTGDRLVNPELGRSLARIVQSGIGEFYEGDWATQLIRDCQQRGGYLTHHDLRNYQVIERSPLMTHYRGETLVTNPPPSSGGTLIAFALSLLDDLNVRSLGFGSEAHLRTLAQVMRLTNQARKDGYDARLYEPNIATRFLANSHLDIYRTVLQQSTSAQAPLNKWGSTTHLSVVDAEGNAASVTTSNGEGSGYVIPGTGILMNNMLGEADLHPSGFHEWVENQRISSMMAPTIVLNGTRPEIVLGSGGSNRIRTAILQVISNLTDFQMSVDEAVNAPRIHWEEGIFNLEPGLATLTPSAIDGSLNDQMTQWREPNMFFGGVHAVQSLEGGGFDGGGDRRRGGAFAVCD